MRNTNFNMIFSKNMLFYMSGGLSKIRSVFTYVLKGFIQPFVFPIYLRNNLSVYRISICIILYPCLKSFQLEKEKSRTV